MLWSTKNPPSRVKCQHILSKTGKPEALMFLALIFKMKIKAFVKYYIEEFRKEGWEMETFINAFPTLQTVYLPSCWGCVYLYTRCRYDRLTGRHTPGDVGHTSCCAGSTFSPARKLEQGWSSRQGCKNLSPALSKSFPRRRFHHKHIGKALAHMMRPRVGSEAAAELCWVLRHSSWIWDSLVRQPTSKRPRQMQTRARCRLGTKESLLPSVLHSYEIVDMFLKKILQNLIPGRIVSVSQMC